MYVHNATRLRLLDFFEIVHTCDVLAAFNDSPISEKDGQWEILYFEYTYYLHDQMFDTKQ